MAKAFAQQEPLELWLLKDECGRVAVLDAGIDSVCTESRWEQAYKFCYYWDFVSLARNTGIEGLFFFQWKVRPLNPFTMSNIQGGAKGGLWLFM